MSWLVLSLRRLRDDRLPVAGLALLVLVTAFVFGVAPRILERVADDAIRSEVAAAPAMSRNIQAVRETRIGAGGAADPLRPVIEAGDQLAATIPPSVLGLVDERGVSVDTPRWSVTSATAAPAFVTLRVQRGAADHVAIVAGREPTGATVRLRERASRTQPSGPVLAYEGALSVETAAALGVGVGDRLALAIDRTDRLAVGHPDAAALDIVGIYEVPDPGERFWIADTALVRPAIRTVGGPDNQFVDATALLAPAGYVALAAATEPSGLPLRYTWRFYVAPDRFTAATADTVVADLRRMESLFPARTGSAAGGTSLRGSLLAIVERQRVRWRSAEAVLTVAAIGPAAVAAGALGLVVLLVGRRRRSIFAIHRGRGASPLQLGGTVVVEGLLLGLPAAGVAAWLATVAVPGGSATGPIIAAAAVAGLAILFLVAVTLPEAASGTGRDHPTGIARRPSPRRITFELLVVGLAVGGAYLLRERGIRGAGTAGQLVAADPFVAAVPALAGIAAGLVALRLVPIPLAGLAHLAAWRRDLVPVLAMRRAAQGGGGPVLVVLLAIASIGAFSSATLVHLDRAADAAAWQEVGAAFRVHGGDLALPQGIDAAALPGVEAAAGAYRAAVSVGNHGTRVELLAADAAGLERVTRGTPADPGLPAVMLGPAVAPIPAIVSVAFASGPERIRVGDDFAMTVESDRLRFRAVAVRELAPTMPIGGIWAIASRDQIVAARAGRAIPTTEIFLRAPDTSAADLRAALARHGPGVVLDTRAGRAAAVRAAPPVVAVSSGLTAAAAVAAAYAALAIAAALALAAATRAIEVAHLRTLGLTRREAVGLLLVEHGPTLVIAFAAGVALGLGLFVALRPGLGLEAVVGSDVPVALAVDPGQLVILFASIGLVAVFAFGFAALLGRGALPATASRKGVE